MTPDHVSLAFQIGGVVVSGIVAFSAAWFGVKTGLLRLEGRLTTLERRVDEQDGHLDDRIVSAERRIDRLEEPIFRRGSEGSPGA